MLSLLLRHSQIILSKLTVEYTYERLRYIWELYRGRGVKGGVWMGVELHGWRPFSSGHQTKGKLLVWLNVNPMKYPSECSQT